MNLAAIIVCAAAAFAAGPEQDVRQENVVQHIRDLPELRAVYVEPERQEGLARTERIIADKLRAMGYEPQMELLEWTTGRSVPVRTAEGWRMVPDPEPRRWHNVVVEIPGRERPDEVLIIGAHFDAVPTTPGADDNASGVAGALEIARVLRERPMARTVRIVFFNLEEIGLIGAREHAQRVKAAIDAGETTVVGMVSVEMIGYFCDEPGCQRSPIPAIPGVFEPPDTGNMIAVVATIPSREFARALRDGMAEAEPRMPTLLVDFVPAKGHAMPDTRRSDHAPFWDVGVPAAMITDTSEFRNPHYHKPTDTLDTLDHERMTMVVRQIAGAAWRIAGPLDSDADDE